MGRIEDYVEAVTRLLRPDPELHMDIAQEVRAHLEDALEEARARGLSEEESVEAALKAFGAENEIAQGLWQANRRRMRLRAVIKWAARLTLLPAAVLLTVYLCLTDLSWSRQLVQQWMRREFDFDLALAMITAVEVHPRKDLTDDGRFLFEHISQDRSDAQALLERFPDDPRIYANYARLSVASLDDWKSPDLEEALRILYRGESVEPDNAFYDYMKAALLMDHSSEVVATGGVAFEYVDRWGETKSAETMELTIKDRAMLDEAVREVMEGAMKPYYRSYAIEMIDLRNDLMSRLTTLPEQLRMISEAASIRMPHVQRWRAMAKCLPAYASILADEGDREAPVELLRRIGRPAVQMGGDARTNIELLVAVACLRITWGAASGTYERLGMPELAQKAREAFEEENDFFNSFWQEAELNVSHIEKSYGVLGALLLPATPGLNLLWVPPMRTVEHLTLERMALVLLVIAFVLLVLIFGGFNCWNLWKYRRRADGPKLFFVGWRRVARIVLIGLALPVGLYWVYTRLTPWSSMQYGVNYCPARIALELVVVFASVITLVFCLGYRAIRGRSKDAGMAVPQEGPFNPFSSRITVSAAAVLAAGTLMYYASWERDSMRLGVGFLGALAVALFAIVYLRKQFWRLAGKDPEKAHFRMTVVRSMIPILAASLLAVGLTSHTYLRLSEEAQIRLLNQPGQRMFLDELEMTSLRHYRDHLRERNDEWNKSHGIRQEDPPTQIHAD